MKLAKHTWSVADIRMALPASSLGPAPVTPGESRGATLTTAWVLLLSLMEPGRAQGAVLSSGAQSTSFVQTVGCYMWLVALQIQIE